MKQPKMLFIGTTALDVIAQLHQPKSIEMKGDYTVAKFLLVAYASKTELDSLAIRPGGSAANGAVCASRLGAKAAIVSAVGDDPFGSQLLNDLKANKVDAHGVKIVKGGQSSTSLIMLSGGEKSILTYKGAFSKLGPKDLPEKLVRESDVVITTSLTSDENFELFKKAVELAKKQGKKVVFAPSMTMLKAQGRKFPSLHPHFDIAICNDEESMYYTGRKTPLEALKALPGDVRVVTLGPNGAIAYDGKRTYTIGTTQVKRIDTTGAGDAFAASFILSYYTHGSIERALKTATAVASIKVAKVGAHFDGTANSAAAEERKYARLIKVKIT